MRMDSLPPLITDRICGDCEECCYVASVVDESKNFHKPACQKCPFQNHGCTIYGKPERPQICSDFQCSWLRGVGEDKDRPDKSGVMASVNNMNGGTWGFIMDLKKNAHLTTGRGMLELMVDRFNFPIVIVDYDNLEKGKGDYVVIKKTLEHRSSKIKGDLITPLNPNANIYKLIIT